MHNVAEARSEDDGGSMLERLGVSAEAEAVYWAMLKHPTWDVEEVAEALSLPESRVREALGFLAERAMIQPAAGRPGMLRAVSPKLGLTALLAHVEAELSERQQYFATVRASIVAVADAYDNGHERDEVVRLDGLDAVRDRLAELARTARHECATFTAGNALPPTAIESGKSLNQLALERGVAIRNIYQESSRNDPATLAYATWMASIGGRSRTVATVPMRLTLIDREIALLPLDVTDSSKGALEIRSGSMVAALCLLFDQTWELATPFGETPQLDEHGLNPQELTVLRLLNAGHTDESVGRKLGVSGRTARRIVADLMKRLGVESRFQAGAEAVRRGWL
ncbi:transcriptional regulator [Catellatospora citrea]|uniref:Transcriptional regulator n=2 Tax=Catellatospora citrea TaxID=53366 RepID=A0A8J3NWJ8_9ACTN|nr:regulatory LuxR family protein [Catellatospora citrea]GIF94963.1 transcriptional regulator [Catellatospora citrea]